MASVPKYFPTVLPITRDLHGSLVLRFLPILLCLSQIWTDFKEATEQTKGSPHLLLLHCQSSNLPTRANPSFSNQHQMNNCKLSTLSEQQAGSKFHTVFNHDKEKSVHCCRHLIMPTVVPIGLTNNDQCPLSTVIIRPLISLQMNSVSKFELLQQKCTLHSLLINLMHPPC